MYLGHITPSQKNGCQSSGQIKHESGGHSGFIIIKLLKTSLSAMKMTLWTRQQENTHHLGIKFDKCVNFSSEEGYIGL